MNIDPDYLDTLPERTKIALPAAKLPTGRRALAAYREYGEQLRAAEERRRKQNAKAVAHRRMMERQRRQSRAHGHLSPLFVR